MCWCTATRAASGPMPAGWSISDFKRVCVCCVRGAGGEIGGCVCVGVQLPGQHQDPRLQDGASVTLNGYVCVCV